MANFVLVVSSGLARAFQPEHSLIPVDHKLWANLDEVATKGARFAVEQRHGAVSPATLRQGVVCFEIISTAAKFRIYDFASIEDMVQGFSRAERSTIPFGPVSYECLMSSQHRDDHLVGIIHANSLSPKTTYATSQRSNYRMIKYATGAHFPEIASSSTK